MTVLGRFYAVPCSWTPSVPVWRRVSVAISRRLAALTVGSLQVGVRLRLTVVAGAIAGSATLVLSSAAWAAPVTQDGGVESHPIMVALLALLAIPAITSAVTGLLRKVTDGTGVNPRVVVYAASVVVTGLIMVTGPGTPPPDWAGDPAAYTLAWMAWATANAELARRVFELLRPILWPEPETPTA